MTTHAIVTIPQLDGGARVLAQAYDGEDERVRVEDCLRCGGDYPGTAVLHVEGRARTWVRRGSSTARRAILDHLDDGSAT